MHIHLLTCCLLLISEHIIFCITLILKRLACTCTVVSEMQVAANSICLAVPGRELHHTMRFGSTATVLAECRLKYYRISECIMQLRGAWCLVDAKGFPRAADLPCSQMTRHHQQTSHSRILGHFSQTPRFPPSLLQRTEASIRQSHEFIIFALQTRIPGVKEDHRTFKSYLQQLSEDCRMRQPESSSQLRSIVTYQKDTAKCS